MTSLTSDLSEHLSSLSFLTAEPRPGIEGITFFFFDPGDLLIGLSNDVYGTARPKNLVLVLLTMKGPSPGSCITSAIFSTLDLI